MTRFIVATVPGNCPGAGAECLPLEPLSAGGGRHGSAGAQGPRSAGHGAGGSGAFQGARGGAPQSRAGGGAPGAQHGLRTFPACGGAEMRPRAQEGLGREIQGKTDKNGIKAFATLGGGWSLPEQGLMGLIADGQWGGRAGSSFIQPVFNCCLNQLELLLL